MTCIKSMRGIRLNLMAPMHKQFRKGVCWVYGGLLQCVCRLVLCGRA